MILNYDDIIDEGSFGLVFSNKADSSRVIKVFKGFHHPEADIKGYEESEYNVYRGKVCDSEIEAYQTATEYVELNEIIPVFYGSVEIEKILDKNGKDVSSYFLIKKNYSLERLYGESKKWNCWMPDFQRKFNIEPREVIEKFRARNIYAKDADIVVYNDNYWVVDIAMNDSSDFAKILSSEDYDYSNLEFNFPDDLDIENE